MVRIAGFHPADPGSSPGVGISMYTQVWSKGNDSRSFALASGVRISLHALVSWCNWLALRTLNPVIRVQFPVRPFFYNSFFKFEKYLLRILSITKKRERENKREKRKENYKNDLRVSQG